MSMSCAHLARALAKGPVVLEGTFSIRPLERRQWSPPPPLPWMVRADPLLRLCAMMGVFAIVTVILQVIGFLH